METYKIVLFVILILGIIIYKNWRTITDWIGRKVFNYALNKALEKKK